MRAALLVLIVAYPAGQTHELKYRFPKGMVYEDEQQRVYKQELFAQGKVFRTHLISQMKMRRTVLEADETLHPKSERVQVIRFRTKVVESAHADQEGVQARPCEGKTFVWKRLKTKWGLFDREGEVTSNHPLLVEQLKNWRDSRLPKDPIAVGAEWEVPPERFLETTGSPVPKGVQGLANFKLESVEAGVAKIPFRFRFTYKDQSGNVVEVAEKGTWMFDIEHGRDIALSMTGEIEIDKGKTGKATLTMERKVTYLEKPPG